MQSWYRLRSVRPSFTTWTDQSISHSRLIHCVSETLLSLQITGETRHDFPASRLLSARSRVELELFSIRRAYARPSRPSASHITVSPASCASAVCPFRFPSLRLPGNDRGDVCSVHAVPA